MVDNRISKKKYDIGMGKVYNWIISFYTNSRSYYFVNLQKVLIGNLDMNEKDIYLYVKWIVDVQ